MVKFKDLSKLSKKEIDDKVKELDLELVKARVAASKGGKVKIKETKKTLAKLNMIKAKIIQDEKTKNKQKTSVFKFPNKMEEI